MRTNSFVIIAALTLFGSAIAFFLNDEKVKFEDENTQKEYDNFISDLLMLLSEPNVDQVFIDAKIGEESEYDTSATYEPVIIRKIEDYEVEKIIS